MQFRIWFEKIEHNHEFWKRFFLGIWDLQDDDGLGMSLKGFNTDRLSHTAEFQRLSTTQQHTILKKIVQGVGTVSDLVNIAASDDNSLTPGFQVSGASMGV